MSKNRGNRPDIIKPLAGGGGPLQPLEVQAGFDAVRDMFDELEATVEQLRLAGGVGGDAGSSTSSGTLPAPTLDASGTALYAGAISGTYWLRENYPQLADDGVSSIPRTKVRAVLGSGMTLAGGTATLLLGIIVVTPVDDQHRTSTTFSRLVQEQIGQANIDVGYCDVQIPSNGIPIGSTVNAVVCAAWNGSTYAETVYSNDASGRRYTAGTGVQPPEQLAIKVVTIGGNSRNSIRRNDNHVKITTRISDSSVFDTTEPYNGPPQIINYYSYVETWSRTDESDEGGVAGAGIHPDDTGATGWQHEGNKNITRLIKHIASQCDPASPIYEATVASQKREAIITVNRHKGRKLWVAWRIVDTLGQVGAWNNITPTTPGINALNDLGSYPATPDGEIGAGHTLVSTYADDRAGTKHKVEASMDVLVKFPSEGPLNRVKVFVTKANGKVVSAECDAFDIDSNGSPPTTPPQTFNCHFERMFYVGEAVVIKKIHAMNAGFVNEVVPTHPTHDITVSAGLNLESISATPKKATAGVTTIVFDVTPSGGTPTYTYEWSMGGAAGALMDGTSLTDKSPHYRFDADGTYNIMLIVTDSASPANVGITMLSIPVGTAGADGKTTFYAYSLDSVKPTKPDTDWDGVDDAHWTLYPADGGAYKWVCHCKTSVDPPWTTPGNTWSNVHKFKGDDGAPGGNLRAKLSVDNKKGAVPFDVELTVDIVGAVGTPAIDIDWDDGTVDTGATNPKTHSYTVANHYNIKVTVTDPGSTPAGLTCFATISINAMIDKTPTAPVWDATTPVVSVARDKRGTNAVECDLTLKVDYTAADTNELVFEATDADSQVHRVKVSLKGKSSPVTVTMKREFVYGELITGIQVMGVHGVYESAWVGAPDVGSGAGSVVAGGGIVCGTPKAPTIPSASLKFKQHNIKGIVSLGAWVAINSSNNANPALFGTAANHGMVTNDIVFLQGLAGGTWNTLNGKVYKINSYPAANQFTLKDAVTGATISGVGLGTLSSGKIGFASMVMTAEIEGYHAVLGATAPTDGLEPDPAVWETLDPIDTAKATSRYRTDFGFHFANSSEFEKRALAFRARDKYDQYSAYATYGAASANTTLAGTFSRTINGATVKVTFVRTVGYGTAPYTGTIYWGDGTSDVVSSWDGTTTGQPAHTYGTAGSYHITIDLVDVSSPARSGSFSTDATVGAVGTGINVSAANVFADYLFGDTVEAKFYASGGTPNYSWTLDWGDGSTDAGSAWTGAELAKSHIYSVTGRFSIILTATDASSPSKTEQVVVPVHVLAWAGSLITFGAQATSGASPNVDWVDKANAIDGSASTYAYADVAAGVNSYKYKATLGGTTVALSSTPGDHVQISPNQWRFKLTSNAGLSSGLYTFDGWEVGGSGIVDPYMLNVTAYCVLSGLYLYMNINSTPGTNYTVTVGTATVSRAWPGAADIAGIEVQITGDVVDAAELQAYLILSGVVKGVAKVCKPISGAVVVLGGEMDKWGTAFSLTDAQATNSGVQIKAMSGGQSERVKLYDVKMKFYFKVPA